MVILVDRLLWGYATGVMHRWIKPSLTIFRLALLIWVAGLSPAALAQDKVIRMRNGPITTPPPQQAKASLRVQGSDSPVSGLFLVQFTDHLQVAWRDELRARGVELVRFVPDDAFVARLDHARLGEVRALPVVRWVGPYGAELKVFSALHRYLRGESPDKGVAVSILLSAARQPGRCRAWRARVEVSESAISHFTRDGFARSSDPGRACCPLPLRCGSLDRACATHEALG